MLSFTIARAFRWQKMLETGQYATIKEIARTERINPSYVSRVLRLTLLAPATVEAILDGRADAAPTLAEAMKVFPVEWAAQIAAGTGATLTSIGAPARPKVTTVNQCPES